MSDEIQTAQGLASIFQGIVWSLLAVLLAWKGLPAIIRLVHELGIWRGEVGARLESIEHTSSEQLGEQRLGFARNREQLGEIRTELGKHAERLAVIEANGCGTEIVCPMAEEPGT